MRRSREANEAALQTDVDRRVEARLFRSDDELHVPHLLDVELAQRSERSSESETWIATARNKRSKT